MAWNEPGGSGGKRNPWGGNKPEQGPPDLDELIRNLQRKLGALFGGGATGGRPPMSGPARGFGAGAIALVILAIWAFTGLYTVDAAERALILRFGKHVGDDDAWTALASALADRDQAGRQHPDDRELQRNDPDAHLG